MATKNAILSSPDSSLQVIQSAIDALWSRVSSYDQDEDPTCIYFSSAVEGEGTTTISGCTAIGLARHLRQSVLLIEANTYSPGLADYLGMAPTPGLSEVIVGEATLEESLRPTSIPGLTVLPAGGVRDLEAGEFATKTFATLLEQAGHSQSFIILDAPPILYRPEARILLRYATETVLVVRARSTTHQHAESALKILQSGPAPCAGVVMNRYSSEVPSWLAKRGVL